VLESELSPLNPVEHCEVWRGKDEEALARLARLALLDDAFVIGSCDRAASSGQ
jgi:hypothetical protein